jgi:hypothetical protein
MDKTELVYAEISDAADLAQFFTDCAKVIDLKGIRVINEGHNDAVHGAYLLQETQNGVAVYEIELWA